MQDNLLEFLYSALKSKYGIKLATPDPERLRQKLYSIRRECADPVLDELAFVPSPTAPNHLWIVRRKPDASK